MIYTIRMIRKTPNLLPAIAGIALMTITACASASLGEFSKETQDAAIAAAVADAEARAKSAQDAAVAAVRCTTPICDNVVKADDLPSYPTAAASGASAFLTIVGTEISIAGVERSSGVDVLASDINGSTRAGDNMDGFRYFQGQFGGTGNTVFFAGILPTTNLGAPLTAQPTTTAWPGFYSEAGSENNNIMFKIDFANRRITAENPRGDGAVRLNLGFSDSGVISGVVLQHSLGFDNSDVIGFAHATGLIGTEGLVGVFVNSTEDSAGLGFHGGFVAANPSP